MNNTDTITNEDDQIDSRDVIARIDYLQGLVDDGDADDQDRDELQALTDLASQCADYVEDWEFGAELIRESYFHGGYAQQLADDIGTFAEVRRMISEAMRFTTGRQPSPESIELPWPLTHIDWEEAANDLAQDYEEYDFDGVTYLAR